MNTRVWSELTYSLVQCYDLALFGDDAVLGCDFTGTVVELGEGASRYKVGDEVAGLIWGGTFYLLAGSI